MRAVAEEFVGAAQAMAPVDKSLYPKHRGALRDSIEVAQSYKKVAVVVAGGPKAPYAKAQEYGARPHRIPRAGRRARLRFYWEREGRMFVGPSVRHPGNPAQPFFRPVITTINATKYFAAEVVKKWNRFG